MRKPHARAIEVQISARVRKAKGTEITGQLLREAIRYRLEHGEDPPGITLRITGWSKEGHTTSAAGRSQGEAWERFTPLLRARLLDPDPVRTRSRNVRRKVGSV